MPRRVVPDRTLNVVGGIVAAVPPDRMHRPLIHTDVGEDLVTHAVRVVTRVDQDRRRVGSRVPVHPHEVDTCLPNLIIRNGRVRALGVGDGVGDAGVEDQVDELVRSLLIGGGPHLRVPTEERVSGLAVVVEAAAVARVTLFDLRLLLAALVVGGVVPPLRLRLRYVGGRVGDEAHDGALFRERRATVDRPGVRDACRPRPRPRRRGRYR